MSLLARFAPRSPEAAARRRFGLWAGTALIVLLPLWWMWGADIVAGLLRPVAGLVLQLFGLTGHVEGLPDGSWSIGSRLTEGGQPLDFPLTTETLRRLLLGFPLVLAFMVAPPRVERPWRALAVSVLVLSVVFILSVATVTWGGLAPLLDPSLAPEGWSIAVRMDQAPLHPVAAQIAIVGRYVALSVAPLLTALLLWSALNPAGLKTLAAEIKD